MSEERKSYDMLQTEMNKFQTDSYSYWNSVIETILEGQNKIRKSLKNTNERCEELHKENAIIKKELQDTKAAHERLVIEISKKSGNKVKDSTFEIVQNSCRQTLSNQSLFEAKEYTSFFVDSSQPFKMMLKPVKQELSKKQNLEETASTSNLEKTFFEVNKCKAEKFTSDLNPTTQLITTMEENTSKSLRANIQSVQNVKQELNQTPVALNKLCDVIAISSDEGRKSDDKLPKGDGKKITKKVSKKKIKQKGPKKLTQQQYIKKITAKKFKFTIRRDALRLRKADKSLTKRDSIMMAKKTFLSTSLLNL